MVFFLLILLSVLPPSQVELKLNRYFCLAPCAIRATIVVHDPEAIQKGKQLCFSMDDGIPTVRCWPHPGTKRQDVHVKEISVGNYWVSVLTEDRIWDTVLLRVIGPGDEN